MKPAGSKDSNVRPEVGILTSSFAVAPYLKQVRSSADGNTKALGFLPESVYEEFARHESLYVATVNADGQACYAGHLLFDSRFPRAHVLQIFCAKNLRERGIASLLLSTLVDRLTSNGFLSIQARVADELASANHFWEAKGFYIQRTELGRGAKPRRINARILELDTPQLFERSLLATNTDNPLGLAASSSTELPLYLVDLNVLFDLDYRRVRHAQVVDIFRSVHAGHCRLGVSDEVGRELGRTSRSATADPMFELIKTLPQFPASVRDKEQSTNALLASVVFPNQLRINALNANDLSDLRHLETAIRHRLSGFITSDQAILCAAPQIEAQYALRILSPDAFRASSLEEAIPQTVFTPSDRQIELRPTVPNDEESLRRLLTARGVSAAAIAGTWLSPLRTASLSSRLCAWVGEELAGYLSWNREIPGTKQTVAWAFVDERHAEAPSLARLLLRALLESAAVNGPREIRLELVSHQSDLRDSAHQYGFYSTGAHASLVKIAAGSILTRLNWQSGREAIAAVCNLRLPLVPANYSDVAQLVDVLSPDGYRRYLPLDTLETYLSPLLLCLPGRPAVITPIERRFAEPLLGHLAQTSLLPASCATLYAERHYICGPNAIKHLRRGFLILFYESGSSNGLKSVVAIGRIAQAYLMRRDDVDASVLEKSVLTSSTLSDLGASSNKSVAVIDNIFPLRSPVPLSFLRSIGCGDPNQLITTRPITDDQLNAIVNEGQGDG